MRTLNRAVAFVRLMRPQQWIKNGFVLVGLVFGHVLTDPTYLLRAGWATLAFMLISSAVYALNDTLDAARDRQHPSKALRPIASGQIAASQALWFALTLALLALWIAYQASAMVCALIGMYALLNVAYSVGLKRVPVLDIFIIAAGFMLRLLAGTAGIGIDPSHWLLLCGFLLTLFLGFAKRRAELAQLAEGSQAHRPVLAAYSIGFLDAAVHFSAGSMLIAYALYCVAEDTLIEHGTDLSLTLPWVCFGTFRFLWRLRQQRAGADPTMDVLFDPWMLAALAGWMATVVLLIV